MMASFCKRKYHQYAPRNFPPPPPPDELKTLGGSRRGRLVDGRYNAAKNQPHTQQSKQQQQQQRPPPPPPPPRNRPPPPPPPPRNRPPPPPRPPQLHKHQYHKQQIHRSSVTTTQQQQAQKKVAYFQRSPPSSPRTSSKSVASSPSAKKKRNNSFGSQGSDGSSSSSSSRSRSSNEKKRGGNPTGGRFRIFPGITQQEQPHPQQQQLQQQQQKQMDSDPLYEFEAMMPDDVTEAVAVLQQEEQEQQQTAPPPVTQDEGLTQQSSAPTSRPEQQQQQQQQQQEFPTNMNHLTTIDGRNMWQNWKRNFTSPLMAIWDLVDNAFDAAEPIGGRLQIFPDPPFQGDSAAASAAASRNTVQSGGLVLMNTSEKQIKNIDTILKPYSSSKTGLESQDAIGENGIGVKQAAATLSDLSFVMTKNDPKSPNGTTTVSFGIIAKDLQNQNGVYFPSAKIVIPKDDSAYADGRADSAIEQALEDFVNKSGADVKTVMAKYCGGGVLDVDAYKRSIRRLAFHIKQMVFGIKWSESKYVYCMIIHDLLHGGSSKIKASATTHLEKVANGMHANRAGRVASKNKAWSLMEEIQQEAPRQYLHVDPSFTFEIGTNGDTVSFSYWQRRLVEFTGAYVPINKTEDNNTKEELPLSILNGVDQKPTPKKSGQDNNVYNLKIYCGFDAMRVGEIGQTDCLLFVYSRKSGRLIKTFTDARSFLGLSNTSNDYCQGLTIILDDVHGMIPLNPTKQDLAFSEQAYGAIHEKNLKLWTMALSRAYYDWHLKKFNKGKLDLKEGVMKLRKKAQEFIQATDYHVLDSSLDKFPMLRMVNVRPAWFSRRFRIQFDGFEGTSLMRLEYPTESTRKKPKKTTEAERKRLAAQAGLTLEQYDHVHKRGPPNNAPVGPAGFQNAMHATMMSRAAISNQQRLLAQQFQMNGGVVGQPPNGFNGQAPNINMMNAQQPPAKKRRTGKSVHDALSIDSSSESDDERRYRNINQAHAHQAEEQTAEKLKESRNHVMRLQAELAAVKSKFNNDVKDLSDANTGLKGENEELKDLITRLYTKRNEYKKKYKDVRKENDDLKRRLEQAGLDPVVKEENDDDDIGSVCKAVEL